MNSGKTVLAQILAGMSSEELAHCGKRYAVPSPSAFARLIREGWKHARAARIEKFYRLRARAGQVEGVVGVFHGGTMGVQ